MSWCVKTNPVPYYLGIDGGGTKTTCAVGDESRLLSQAVAGPSNIVRVGESQARKSLLEAVRQACQAAGIHPSQVARTCVGGSGAARAEVAAAMRRCLVELISTPVDVVGDMEIALQAAFGEGPGVIVIAGTGSIAYGRDQNGNTARAGGWGFAIGDEGSAHWIGREAVRAVLRASDANEEKASASPLVAALYKAWGVESLADLARAANSNPPPDFAALFPAIAGSSENLAIHVLTDAGRELSAIAAIVIRRLFVEAVPVHVAITGSVFRYAARVRETFYHELRKAEPRAGVNLQVVDPVEGALRMARRACAG
jgi:N-acetylglucosamine kinase-like BadF-type ATPase